MTAAEARRVIFDVLSEIAPEVEEAAIDPGQDLTVQLDLDSMDYLNWMIGISERTGVDVPHWAVDQFITIDGAISYLTSAAR